jgi:signal transduction histidine kinase
MPAGGVVRIETNDSPTMPPPSPDDLPVTMGPFVRVRIRDSGPGIPAEILPRIFDAFFTTKTRGSGLGLPTSRHIARTFGGTLVLANLPEGGTAADLYLSCVTASGGAGPT